MVESASKYRLLISNVDQIVWIKSLLRRNPPNLYVEIQLEQSVQRTRVIKRSTTPNWNEEIPLQPADTESVLTLSVKHDTTKPLFKDLCLGTVDIKMGTLLSLCENNQSVNLRLKSTERQTENADRGFITIKLSVDDQAIAIAISNAQGDIERSNLLGSTQLVGHMGSHQVLGPIAVTGNLVGALGNVVSKLSVFIQFMDKTSAIHPYANFAWQVTSSLYKAIKGQLERDKKIVDLVTTMDDVYSFVDAIRSVPKKLQLLEDIIVKILKQTVECAIFIREYTGHGFAARVARQTFSNTGQAIDDLSNNLIALKQSFDSSSILQAVFISTRTFEEVVRIENLKMLNPVRMDAFSRPECLPETREDVLKSITDWLTTPSDENILWLHGVAGSGKSTISTTIAEYFREIGRLGAFMFFDRADPTSSEPAAVIRTLSYKLALFDSTIKAAICAQIERDLGITEASIRVQFSKLILEPLASLPAFHTHGPIVVILDALDECGDPTSRKSLLLVLAQGLAKLPSVFRFLITSRREFDIEAALFRRSNVVAKELDISTRRNASDISSYLSHHLAIIRANGMFQLTPDWPGTEREQTLARTSGGLFIWASTAVKFIADGHHPDQQLDILLRSHRREAESALDALYGTALRTAGKWENDEIAADFRAVLGIIVVGRVPLSDATIDRLLGMENSRSSAFILLRLRCLLHWTPGLAVQTLHASFADYLTDARRSGSDPWFIDTSIHHQTLALACFRSMKTGLRFNICKLETSYVSNEDVPDLPERIEKFIPSHLSYACRFWGEHLQEIVFGSECVCVLVDFLHFQMLHWLEVLSLIKEIPLAAVALLSANNWSKAHDKELASFAQDATTFVSIFQAAISFSAPHIYISAIPLSPTDSMISKQFLSQFPRRLSVDIGVATDWPTNLHVLDGHIDVVNSVAFSSDGKWIVSGSQDQTIRVWDAKAGNVVLALSDGHTDYTSVAFSPDGRLIVSGSDDSTIRLWDAETGEGVLGPLRGHTDSVLSVAFSPDQKYIASSSQDATVRLWHADTGEDVLGPLRGHTKKIMSVAFSYDGKLVVSGSHDMTLCVWDTKTGERKIGPLKGHGRAVTSVAFSLDGKIASGSLDCMLRIWTTRMGTTVSQTFEGHTDYVISVAFSHNGKNVASGSVDQTIRLWDVDNGVQALRVFEGDAGAVMSVAFSPDDKQIASGLFDHTVHLWDIQANELAPGHSNGHTNAVLSIAVSPDGRRIVSCSPDRTIRLWDTETSSEVSLVGKFRGHTNVVMSVAFSHGGKHIISGSVDGTIRIWDAATGREVSEPFRGHADVVRSVAVSPDGKRIASGSYDQTVRLWDAETGSMTPLPCRGIGAVRSVAFSPDGTRIVSGSYDMTLRLWEVETGNALLDPLRGHTDVVMSVVFSPNGQRIVSSSGDMTIRLWDAETGNQVLKLLGHTASVRSVAFSPDGTRIVSGSFDRTLRLWDVETGNQISEPLRGHTDYVMSVAFLPEGTRVVSGSQDQTIRLWDIDAEKTVSSPSKWHIDELTFSSNSSDTNERITRKQDFNIGTVVKSQINDGFYDGSQLLGGWMLGKQSELLFWVPPYYRKGLWWPRNIAVIGRRTTRLNFDQFVHGWSWTQCGEKYDIGALLTSQE